MTNSLDALRTSTARLRRIVEPLGPEQLSAQSYDAEWSVADVLSHLGSGAVIMHRRIDANLEGVEVAPDFANPIWDEWNAKSPEAKSADSLRADVALTDRFDSLTDEQRSRLVVSMGPVQFDFEHFVGARLNEHVLHTWDIEVAFEPNATVPAEAARFVVDNLAMIVQYTGKPTGAERDVHVRTVDPARRFTLSLGADGVALVADAGDSVPDLELPAEAFARLVYGRLDAAHTPPFRGTADLDELRRVFPAV